MYINDMVFYAMVLVIILLLGANIYYMFFRKTDKKTPTERFEAESGSVSYPIRYASEQNSWV